MCLIGSGSFKMERLQQHTINKDEAVISITGLYKSFDDLHVLKGIDFTLYKGENVAILGKSGTGKSVLIKIIIGLLKPDKGEVVALGKNVSQLNRKEMDELRLRIGFSFQSSALYDGMNVFQNLAFPLQMNKKNITKKEIAYEVEKTLEAVGLKDKTKQMPSELSGGQRKRIGIARTLILRPEIMLYDEPTAGLDPITCTEIIDLINHVQHQYNTSSIIITHDLTCAKNTSDRVAMLLEGQFVKVGTFDEVFDTDDQHLTDFYSYNFIH
jgi:phospholipid/cholesterol/gamma-HCH transport system ATP-binding protein